MIGKTRPSACRIKQLFIDYYHNYRLSSDHSLDDSDILALTIYVYYELVYLFRKNAIHLLILQK